MRIGIDGMLLSGRFSGVEHYILNVGRHLGGLPGADVTVFVPRGFKRDRLRTHGPVRAVRAIAGGWSRMFRVLWEQLWLPVKSVGYSFDLMHFPGYIHPPVQGIPTVLTVHDVIALTAPEVCDRGNIRYYRQFLPRSIARATRIITPTAAVRDEVCRLFKRPAGTVDVVPMGTDIGDRPAGVPVRDIYGIGTGPYLLCVGNLEPKKGLVLMVKAFFAAAMHARYPHKLVIAGHHGWRYRGFYNLLRQLGPEFRARVILAGYVPDEHLASLYRGAELFVFPSLLEGFGIPPLEAMACGTPVLMSDTPALAENYRGRAHFFKNGDLPGLRENLETLLADPALRGAHVEGARALAAGLTWARCAAATMEVYRRACDDFRRA